MNDNFNDDEPEININDFDVTSQYHYITFNDLCLLLHYNDDTEKFIIPTDFISITNSRDIAVKVQEKIKYRFKFSGFNILDHVGSLMTRNRCYIKGSRYVNHCMQNLWYVTKFKSFLLLYIEEMLFPSLHWESTNENALFLEQSLLHC